ncbi:MAG TPA: hypothetical protein VKA43_06965 [Gammaproteobacteria bacterium]|nr:hypothetical protein [Gammaproteobacteria bacterium]
MAFVLFGLAVTSPASPQAVEGAQVVASLAELDLPVSRVRTCPSPESPDASCHPPFEAHGAMPARNTHVRWPVSAPEPPDWMVWLCGIAVAAVIALRRIRGRWLAE